MSRIMSRFDLENEFIGFIDDVDYPNPVIFTRSVKADAYIPTDLYGRRVKIIPGAIKQRVARSTRVTVPLSNAHQVRARQFKERVALSRIVKYPLRHIERRVAFFGRVGRFNKLLYFADRTHISIIVSPRLS